jgi:hypothetical protein
MRKLMMLAAILFITEYAYAQKKETRNVDTFTKISFRTSGKVYVRQGSPQKVQIEGTSEMLDKIKTRVEGGKLIIGPESDRWFNWNWKDDSRVTVYITVKDIEALSVSGSGDLIAETKIVSNRLDLNVSGSGSIKAEIDAGSVKADVSGSGNMDLFGKCSSFKSDISGSGDITLSANISNEAEFDISGSGKAVASGTAKYMKADITGSGRIRAADMQVTKCDIRISGSGDIQIHVIEELDARISGSGTVSYKGNPAHVNSNANGSGKVRKM